MNPIQRIINRIEYAADQFDGILAEYPDLTWESACKKAYGNARYGGLFGGDSEEERAEKIAERRVVMRARALVAEIVSLIGECKRLLRSEGVDVSSPELDRLGGSFGGDLTPQDFSHVCRSFIGVLRAKSMLLG